MFVKWGVCISEGQEQNTHAQDKEADNIDIYTNTTLSDKNIH